MEQFDAPPESVAQPSTHEGSEEGRFARVNTRAASMILAALKEEVRTECVAKKVTGSSAGLLFRLLTLYRPGGENEKIMILSQLQSPPKHSDPGKAAEALRAWLRWLQRADDVSLAKPDPNILARGLTAMTAEILQNNPEAMFRTSLVKSTLQVDTVPTMTSVLEFHRHLTSAMEVLQTSPRKTRKADEIGGRKAGHLQKDCPTKEGQKAGGKAADASPDSRRTRARERERMKPKAR